MNRFLTLTLLSTLFVFGPIGASAKSECRMNTGYGLITGNGTNPEKAYEDAAEKCFDKMTAMAKRRPQGLSELQGVLFIDQCVNIDCQE